MCNIFSLVLTKDRVFWSQKTDSHQEIIEEFHLHVDGSRGPNILKVEISPPTLDSAGLRSPLREWRYKIDQDIYPKWHNTKRDKARAITALKKLTTARIIVNRDAGKLSDWNGFLLGNSRAKLLDNSNAVLRGNSRAESINNYAVAVAHCPQVVVPIGPHAVLIDQTKTKAICIVGKKNK